MKPFRAKTSFLTHCLVYCCLLPFFSQQHWSHIFPSLVFSACLLWDLLFSCCQVSEWKSCPAAGRSQPERLVPIPAAAAQALYWLHQEPARGQPGTVRWRKQWAFWLKAALISTWSHANASCLSFPTSSWFTLLTNLRSLDRPLLRLIHLSSRLRPDHRVNEGTPHFWLGRFLGGLSPPESFAGCSGCFAVFLHN